METNEMLEKVLGEINKVHDKGQENLGQLNELKEKAAKLEGDIALIEQKTAADLELIRAGLKTTYGKSGADDFSHDFGAWIRAAYLKQRHGKDSTEKFANGAAASEFVSKTAATFDTTTAATAGSLVPTIFRPGIITLLDIFGSLYPRVTKMTCPPGQALRINSQSVNPVAAVRTTQGGSMTEEGSPQTFAYDTITTQLTYVYQTIANELMMNPNVDINTVFAMEGIKAIVRKIEALMLSSTSDTAPSYGVTSAASVNAQTTMASATFANIVTFLKECAADNAYSVDPTRNCLFLHPRDALTLAGQAVGASELTGMLVWGNPRTGIPTTLLGYEVIVHPSVNNGTNTYAILGQPQSILLGETGSFSVDFSDQVKFGDFETAMRVYSHFDYSICQPTEWHKAIVTA